MEKLKVTHDHSLTDILKVLIFTLVLLIPGFMFLPSMLYFGFNEQANAPTKQEYIKEIVTIDFNQYIQNGNFNNLSYWNRHTYDDRTGEFTTTNNIASVVCNSSGGGIYYNATLNLYSSHIYVVKIDLASNNNDITDVVIANLHTQNNTTNTLTTYDFRVQPSSDFSAIGGVQIVSRSQTTLELSNIMLFDLTQMYGSGYEPSIDQFNSIFDKNYYEYTTSEEMQEERVIGEETVVDITTQLEYNWEQIWQKPILEWTNRSILKNGLDNFTQAFGITNTSYLNNLITYELIMVGVYIVIDIVLALFKWLTHMIGNK